MSSYAALFVLALAGQTFAAPVAAPYNNGQYSSIYQEDAYWTGAPAPTAAVVAAAPVQTKSIIAVATTTSVAATVAATSAPASAATSSAATVSTQSESTGATVAQAKKSYTGNGGAGWPTVDQWLSFDALWTINEKIIACDGGIQNSASENQAIQNGIISVSKSTGVDERYILATIMQESHGCVRVGATSLGVTNPGIMQDHDGSHNCAGAAAGACSDAEITGMINDGVAGTASGSGLQELMAKAKTLGGTTISQQTYMAARLYNSGDNALASAQYLDNLSAPIDATASYSSDIANRLVGVSI